MKSKIIALALFAATAATVAFFPLTGSTGTVTPPLADLGIATTVAATATLLAEVFKRRFVRNNHL